MTWRMDVGEAVMSTRSKAMFQVSIPIACLVTMAILPLALYHLYLDSAMPGWEPSFLLGSAGALKTMAAVWLLCGGALAILFTMRMFGRRQLSTDLETQVLMAASLALFALMAAVLVLFALNLMDAIEWTYTYSWVFCIVPTIGLVIGGLAFTEQLRPGSYDRRAALHIAIGVMAVSVPWGLFVAIFGFLGFGGAS